MTRRPAPAYLSGGLLEGLPGGLIGAIERRARFRQASHQDGPGLGPRLLQFLELLVGYRGVGLHAGDGRLNFAPTFRCQSCSSRLKFIGRFTPGFQLSVGLKLEGRLLLLDLPAKAFDIFLNLGLETSPIDLQLSLRTGPRSLVGLRLLL